MKKSKSSEMMEIPRRTFLNGMGVAVGGAAFVFSDWMPTAFAAEEAIARKGATVHAAFLYPPSKNFAGNKGWWSWPGNQFDAEGRQKQYTAELRKMEKKLGMSIAVEGKPVANKADAGRLAAQLKASKPDGLLIMMFYNGSLGNADLLLKQAAALGLPVVFYIPLGAKHMPVGHYRRPGVYFIQSLENFEAIECGLRMINARTLMGQSVLLSIADKGGGEGAEPFFGTKIRAIPFGRYAEEFKNVQIDKEVRALIAGLTKGAREVRGVSEAALENAARAHFALKKLLSDERADGLAMKCLRRGMLKPCMSFSMLNDALVPAACQNDFNSALTMLLAKHLIGKPGFIHNLCYDTEHNTFYASHCTCPRKVYGPDGAELPYLLRRFMHSNEGSCAIQVFWKEGDPVTIVEYYPAKASNVKSTPGPRSMWMTETPGDVPMLDIYAGKVVKSHPMPPAGGCCTNVEVQINDRDDACKVYGGHGHHVLFYGDFARRFRLFANLYKMKLG